MTLPRTEIPGRGGGSENLPPVTKQNRGLYKIVLWFLGAALILLILGWMALTWANRQVPEAVPVVIATIVGALVAAITADKQGS